MSRTKISILLPFLDNPSLALSVLDVVQASDLSQQYVWRVLRDLAKDEWFTTTEEEGDLREPGRPGRRRHRYQLTEKGVVATRDAIAQLEAKCKAPLKSPARLLALEGVANAVAVDSQLVLGQTVMLEVDQVGGDSELTFVRLLCWGSSGNPHDLSERLRGHRVRVAITILD